MKLNNILAAGYVAAYDNDLDALVPELWAQESLAVLEENMVAGLLVHRDFEDEIANFGDTVNTRKPGEFNAKRKGANDSVTVQAANSTNIPVKLDQHVHTSFLIRDGEESKSFNSLVDDYLSPAMIAQASFVDKIVLGQFPAFLANQYGDVDGLSGSTAKEYILGARQVLNENKAHVSGRNFVWCPSGETAALNTDIFLTADRVGDDGSALREASLGRKLGFDHFMAQNMSDYADSDVAASGAINGGSVTKGTTTVTVDGFSAAIGAGSFVKIDGQPHRVVSTVGGATPTSITIAAPGLSRAVGDNDVVVHYGGGAVNNGSGYAAGYDKYVAFDGATLPPRQGQMVTFGASATSAVFTIVDVDGSSILLDRPLEAALSDNDVINLGPGGAYNFAFHKNAIALVTRPLAPPKAGTGALSAVVNFNGLSMRAVITYDGNQQGHLVTLDMLCGVKVLDSALGAVLVG